ncbi:MAG: LacI family DNA-binding transcriptional regulator [Actinomycetaceae bacterium]|nr:LacI family DNA-binding transcriptional regulator [Actinomycetaceae bacterium]
MKRPTIRDIAKEARVSQSAVSFALNDRPGVSDETRARVRGIATQMGWAPNPAARALTGASTSSIGLVIARPRKSLSTEKFYFQLICGIESILSPQNFTLALQIVDTIEAEKQVYHQWWTQRRVDGVILTDLRNQDPRPAHLQTLSIPAVAIGQHVPGCPSLLADDYGAVRSVVEYLHQQGHKNIAYVAGIMGLEYSLARASAFEVSCGEAGIETRALSTDYTEESGQVVTRHMITSADPPTAIVYDNEILALGGMSAIEQEGLRIPQDIAVVSLEDAPLCKVANPTITALNRDPIEMGAMAATMLLEYLERGSAGNVHAPSPQLVVRDST